MKKLKPILILLFVFFTSVKVFGQSLTYTFIDPCTKDVTHFSIPIQGGAGTTIFFLGQQSYFTANDVASGAFANWINQVYSDYRKVSPCGVQQGQVTQNQITSQIIGSTVQSVVGSIMSQAKAESNLNTSSGGGMVSDNSKSGDDKKVSKQNNATNNSNGNSTNSSTTQSGGQSQSGSGTGGSNGNSNGNQGNGNSTSGGGSAGSGNSNEGGSQSSQPTVGTGGGNGNSGSGTSGNGNTGSGTSGNGSGNSNNGNNNSSGNSDQGGSEVAGSTTMTVDAKNDRGSDNSSSGGGSSSKGGSKGGNKGGAKNNPVIVSSDLTSAQNLDKSYTGIINVGMSQSSMTGTSSWGLNSMIWFNLKQFAVTGRYTKIQYSKNHKIRLIHNLNLTGVYSYGNILGFLGYSAILNAGVWGITGVNVSGAFTKTPDDNNIFISPSATAFYTKPIKVNKKLIISPELYVISTPLIYSSVDKVTVTDRTFSAFIGTGIDYQITKRFKVNLNYKLNMSTNPDFPILSFFLIGSKINL